MNKKATDIEIEESSGNVFDDVGLPRPEECLVKADLAIQINKLIKARKFNNQEDAARFLDLDQPKISALNRGRLSGFSVERLFKLLSMLDQDIEIVIKPHHGRRAHPIPHIYVRYAVA